MDSITKQLTSPEWWFTVVIVGLIIGIISAYAKDWLTYFLSSLSSRYRKYAQTKLEARANEIAMLVAYKEMLIIEYIRTAFHLFASATLLTGSYFLPGWHLLRKQFPEVDPLQHLFNLQTLIVLPGLTPETMQAIGSLLLLTGGLFFWNAFLNRHFLCEQARTKILETHCET